MSYYYYYSKIDKTQEKLGKIEAHSKEEAIKKLAEYKRLDIDFVSQSRSTWISTGVPKTFLK